MARDGVTLLFVDRLGWNSDCCPLIGRDIQYFVRELKCHSQRTSSFPLKYKTPGRLPSMPMDSADVGSAARRLVRYRGHATPLHILQEVASNPRQSVDREVEPFRLPRLDLITVGPIPFFQEDTISC